MKKVFLCLLLTCVGGYLFAQKYLSVISFLPDERWWGGFVGLGNKMPYLQPTDKMDLASQNFNNQNAPLLVSNKGRYIWSDEAFTFTITSSGINIQSEYETIQAATAGTTLRDAYLSACKKHFPPSGVLPDSLFFSMPQYNTWIELMYNQHQEGILEYARNIMKHGFPKGVLMIDDNWQKYYGNFDFKPDKFSDAKNMVAQLHEMGFKIMLWMCPFVSPDSPEYRDLRDKGFLIRGKGRREPAIISWWNGQSACYDFTNPEACKHFISQLKHVQEKYGIDGFKFDAGDVGFYDPEKIDSYKKDATSTDHCIAWAQIGLHFPFNEYRACWKMGGEALVQRLGDKHNSWSALQSLIPDMVAAGLLGYSYACPDMVGGGQIASFVDIDPSKINQDLIVRSAQTHALMPMMQFSVAPWRILYERHLSICRTMAQLHVKMAPYILACAKHASQTGEPIVRHMEYMFPGEGFADCNEQYMLGEKYLVAPIVAPASERTVKLPKGRWRDESGKIYKGGKVIRITATIERLPYFEKLR